MSKSLYSLILSDDIVNMIDAKAKLMNESRSSLINQILAEYVSYETPEHRMRRLFGLIEQQMRDTTEQFRLMLGQNDSAFSAMSVLKYKYNPSVRYSVTLFGESDNLGELRVMLRTQNANLIDDFESFVNAWNDVENKAFKGTIDITMPQPCVMVRRLNVPKNVETADDIAKAVSDYITCADNGIKLFLSAPNELERYYINCYEQNKIRV